MLFAGGGFTTDSPGSLLDVIAKAGRELGASPQLVHYLAVPPVAFTGLTKALGQHNLAKGARVVYEKPFGTAPKAFRELDRAVHSVLRRRPQASSSRRDAGCSANSGAMIGDPIGVVPTRTRHRGPSRDRDRPDRQGTPTSGAGGVRDDWAWPVMPL